MFSGGLVFSDGPVSLGGLALSAGLEFFCELVLSGSLVFSAGLFPLGGLVQCFSNFLVLLTGNLERRGCAALCRP